MTDPGGFLSGGGGRGGGTMSGGVGGSTSGGGWRGRTSGGGSGMSGLGGEGMGGLGKSGPGVGTGVPSGGGSTLGGGWISGGRSIHRVVRYIRVGGPWWAFLVEPIAGLRWGREDGAHKLREAEEYRWPEVLRRPREIMVEVGMVSQGLRQLPCVTQARENELTRVRRCGRERARVCARKGCAGHVGTHGSYRVRAFDRWCSDQAGVSSRFFRRRDHGRLFSPLVSGKPFVP